MSAELAELREEVQRLARDGGLLDAIFEQYGRRYLEDDDPALIVLSDLHNDGSIDLLEIVSPDSIAAYSGPKLFHGQQLYTKLIRRLKAPAADLLAVVRAFLDAAGQDMAAGAPVEEFAKWCAEDPGRPSELLALIDADSPGADRFLTIAIKSGVAVDEGYFMDRAYGFLRSGTEIQKQGAIQALGQVDLVDDNDWLRLWEAFAASIDGGQSDATNGVILSALARRLAAVPEAHAEPLMQLAIAIVALGGDHVLDTVARAIAFAPDHIPANLLNAMLAALHNVKAANLGTIEMLDLALAKLLGRGKAAEARTVAAHLIRRDPDPIDPEKLDAMWYRLRELGGETFNDWIVAWLRDGDRPVCAALDDELFGAGSDEVAITVDFARYALADAEYPYLARKAIGSFFLKSRLMASILVSLLRSAPADQIGEIVDLLVNPILVNYSGVGSEYLSGIAQDETDPAAVHVKRALEALEAYLDGLKAVGRLPEFQPSERERTIEWQRHADQMAEAYRLARRKSILASIASERILLYGTRSVSWVPDPADTPRRIETQLGSISHSFELPRIEIIDPLGLQFLLMSFRGEERPE